jgi:hypothetical protein
MDHEAAKSIPVAPASERPAPLTTRRRTAAKRGLVPQWLVVLTMLLVASVVVERVKTPPSPVSAARASVESLRFNRT